MKIRLAIVFVLCNSIVVVWGAQQVDDSRDLKAEIAALRAELQELREVQKEQYKETKTDISQLQTATRLLNNTSSPIAFTAHHGANKDYWVGETIQFEFTFYNNFNGFNPETGIFTCPESGVYLFTISVLSASDFVAVELRAEFSDLTYTYNSPSAAGQYEQATTTAITYCQAGDRVWAQVYAANPEPATVACCYGTSFAGVRIG